MRYNELTRALLREPRRGAGALDGAGVLAGRGRQPAQGTWVQFDVGSARAAPVAAVRRRALSAPSAART